MKFKFIIAFLLFSLPVFAADFLYSGKLYSGVTASQVTGIKTYGMYEAGIDFGFGIRHERFKFDSKDRKSVV